MGEVILPLLLVLSDALPFRSARVTRLSDWVHRLVDFYDLVLLFGAEFPILDLRHRIEPHLGARNPYTLCSSNGPRALVALGGHIDSEYFVPNLDGSERLPQTLHLFQKSGVVCGLGILMYEEGLRLVLDAAMTAASMEGLRKVSLFAVR